MGIFGDSLTTTVDGQLVHVVSRSGPVSATWRLLEGDTVLDETQVARGARDLTGTTSTGTEVQARIEQSLLGPTTITITAGGVLLAQTEGYTA